MKKLILSLSITLTTVFCNAQLVVKETAKDSVVWQASKLSTVPKIVKFTTAETEDYTIYYRNAKYTAITDIDYISTGDLETTIQFFDLCKEVITSGKEYTVDVDKKSVLISKGTLGTVMIWTSTSYFYLSTKQINSILETLK